MTGEADKCKNHGSLSLESHLLHILSDADLFTTTFEFVGVGALIPGDVGDGVRFVVVSEHMRWKK